MDDQTTRSNDSDSIRQVEGFLLTRHWEDVPLSSSWSTLRSLQLTYWLLTERGPLQVRIDGEPALFFLSESEVPVARELLQREFGRSASHPSLMPTWEIRSLQLRDFRQQAVSGVYFREQHALYRARELLVRHGLTPLEADIQPGDRYLMERFITGPVRLEGRIRDCDTHLVCHNPRLQAGDFAPVYRVMSLDIETSMSGDHLYCIGAVVATSDRLQSGERVVMMVGQGDPPESQGYLSYWPDEAALLGEFIDWFQRKDVDVIIGWNVINFDLRFLQRKADSLSIALDLGRAATPLDWRQSREDSQHYNLTVPGRLVLDGIETLKSAAWNLESYSLQAVSEQLLQRGKLTHDVDNRGEAITLQFLHDKPALAEYNLEDCQLVLDIFERAGLFDFAVQRASLTGLAMDRFGGSVAAFDNRYLPRLHRRGYVAPALPIEPEGVGSPGGYVMDSEPGFYDDVLVLDFKSLYPSIIRTFRIDPLARIAAADFEQRQGLPEREPLSDQQETTNVDREHLVPGFNGAVFLKQDALLPELIRELWQARDQAKQDGNRAMSQVIKILMNSFYGVLGTPGCRFFDYRLPGSITLRGHRVLTRTRELIEALGHRVIYGDTDSVFVCLGGASGLSLLQIEQQGSSLAKHLNDWWKDYLRDNYRIESFLEIQFETHYSRFFMPAIRGTQTGSKKRYAGLIETAQGEPQLVFKGLEAVRSDWTPLAREFQRELYRRVFLRLPYEQYIRQLLVEIRCGQHDSKLVFRKRIRRQLLEYSRNVPPHVQAARKADHWLQNCGLSPRYARGGWIRYALTVNGPEPLENLCSRLDYELLIERQIEPIVDAIVQFTGTSFARIADRQMGLFSS